MWAVVGIGGALSVVSFALGPLVVVPTAIAALLLARSEAARESAFGLLAGAGLLLAFVAWLNRHGPFDPAHWLAAGLVLIAAGVAGHARRL